MCSVQCSAMKSDSFAGGKGSWQCSKKGSWHAAGSKAAGSKAAGSKPQLAALLSEKLA